ncbi:MAG: SLC13 family permease [Granulosicoccus sp.]|nr:SLC13 family permease [Granulosicoccus sp.]
MAQELTLSIEMLLVMGLLAITIVLFAFELLRVDVAAITMMVLLGLTTMIPGLTPLISRSELFSGFSSNAVISVIAVMIIGAGLDKTGLMGKLASLILLKGGKTEKRIIPLVSGAVAIISSFMQNIGAAALFLPVVSRISARTDIPMSRLLMPMGFCAILGGTVTMIGSSPLILLNDLLLSSNKMLPEDQQMDTFSLFSVTPVGLALVASGVIYFVLAGRFVLPAITESDSSRTSRTADYFERLYGIKGELVEVRITVDSPQVGMTIHQVEDAHPNTPAILALYSGDVVKVPPDREEMIWVNTHLGLMGDREQIEQFCSDNNWELLGEPDRFADVLNAQHSGIAEVVIPPGSSLIGQQIGDIKPRRSFGTNILQIYRSEDVIRSGFRDQVLQAGDTLVVHASWKDLKTLSRNRDFVLATDVKYEDLRINKIREALIFFTLALGLFLLTDSLSISLLTGAIGMILSGVLTMDEAYAAVSWQTVFLLASLIPLGIAVDQSGTAAWIAQEILALVGDVPIWVLQVVIALLATFFTLVMSNIGATVLLVPLAVNIALAVGADPALFALTVAISTSNSFLIPTHQVNALLMGPGGYHVADFMRAGGIMTVLFLLVSLLTLNLLY